MYRSDWLTKIQVFRGKSGRYRTTAHHILAGSVSARKPHLVPDFAWFQPQSATTDIQASKPDEAVWLLRCEDASYRVRLMPDMAAQVEPIDQ